MSGKPSTGSPIRRTIGSVVGMIGGWVVGKIVGNSDLVVKGGISNAWSPSWDADIVLLAILLPGALLAPRFGMSDGWLYGGALSIGGLMGIIGTAL
ncbi:MAG: hypothetical protein CML66_05915 [Rhodobacteraceae bacterium]|nr:hypothetical protein [Paracoccaceae bacterium]MAY46539.1 hypothetical protein [Paracoccaceae bacterium]